MMNRWLRGFWLLACLLGVAEFSFAACETEFENGLTASINSPNYRGQTRESVRAMNMRAEPDNERYRKSLNAEGFAKQEADYLAIIRTRTDAPDMVAWTIFNLCMLRNSRVSSGTQVLGNQQSPTQPRQSQQQAQQIQGRADQPQQNQSAQQQAQQAQQAATIRQVRADQARQGKRRQHEPENEAHQCLTIDTTSPDFGSFVNKCNFKISYSFCNYKPKKDSWADFHNCEGRSGNSDFIGPNGTSAAHVKNTETVYFFACKDPSWSLDTEYVPGQGLRGRCYTVGGK